MNKDRKFKLDKIRIIKVVVLLGIFILGKGLNYYI